MNIEQLQKMYSSNKAAVAKSLKFYQHLQKEATSHNLYEDQINECIKNLEMLKLQNQFLQEKQIPETFQSWFDFLQLANIYKEINLHCNCLAYLPQEINIIYYFAPSSATFSQKYVPELFRWQPTNTESNKIQEKQELKQDYKIDLQKQSFEEQKLNRVQKIEKQQLENKKEVQELPSKQNNQALKNAHQVQIKENQNAQIDLYQQQQMLPNQNKLAQQNKNDQANNLLLGIVKDIFQKTVQINELESTNKIYSKQKKQCEICNKNESLHLTCQHNFCIECFYTFSESQLQNMVQNQLSLIQEDQQLQQQSNQKGFFCPLCNQKLDFQIMKQTMLNYFKDSQNANQIQVLFEIISQSKEDQIENNLELEQLQESQTNLMDSQFPISTDQQIKSKKEEQKNDYLQKIGNEKCVYCSSEMEIVNLSCGHYICYACFTSFSSASTSSENQSLTTSNQMEIQCQSCNQQTNSAYLKNQFSQMNLNQFQQSFRQQDSLKEKDNLKNLAKSLLMQLLPQDQSQFQQNKPKKDQNQLEDLQKLLKLLGNCNFCQNQTYLIEYECKHRLCLECNSSKEQFQHRQVQFQYSKSNQDQQNESKSIQCPICYKYTSLEHFFQQMLEILKVSRKNSS